MFPTELSWWWRRRRREQERRRVEKKKERRRKEMVLMNCCSCFSGTWVKAKKRGRSWSTRKKELKFFDKKSLKRNRRENEWSWIKNLEKTIFKKRKTLHEDRKQSRNVKKRKVLEYNTRQWKRQRRMREEIKWRKRKCVRKLVSI